ncbi:hypothetical protein GALMADRAFT_210669 [Galerina marginata CBS 339.88]|uniref:MYND-type domain-containing protein n=1 Tax=Galerina marginata (strain CBS 339.88) TaxID=685588 RepID=A0A067T0Z3_GALM3|nr:hypothetical protein GALMADRAFT_210669 [Galerina marginata CBS 339.88]
MNTRNCLVCGTPSTKWCSGCKTASYCTEEHQNQDWRSHKAYCLKVKAAGDKTLDAILFGVNESTPRLVKIPWELARVFQDDPDTYQKLDTDIWFPHKNKAVKPLFFNRWGINGPDLGRGLCFFYDDNFGMNGLALNRCIVAVTGSEAGHEWCGNVLGLRMKENSYDFYEDVNMEEDLKPFVEYFEEYNKVDPIY